MKQKWSYHAVSQAIQASWVALGPCGVLAEKKLTNAKLWSYHIPAGNAHEDALALSVQVASLNRCPIRKDAC